MINVISMNTNTAGRKLFRLSVLPIALISFCQFAGASTYYVATNGNDSNPGSLSAPFQTLQRGANQAIAGDIQLHFLHQNLLPIDGARALDRY